MRPTKLNLIPHPELGRTNPRNGKIKEPQTVKGSRNHEYIQFNSNLEAELAREQVEKESLFRRNKLLTEEINQLKMENQ